eukprot:7316527-Lingulodinium_polyedra.AAC.1
MSSAAIQLERSSNAVIVRIGQLSEGNCQALAHTARGAAVPHDIKTLCIEKASSAEARANSILVRDGAGRTLDLRAFPPSHPDGIDSIALGFLGRGACRKHLVIDEVLNF